MMEILEDDFVDELEAPNTDAIVWHDKEMRCANKGCGSPTFHVLYGVPYCMIHTLHKCNELLNGT